MKLLVALALPVLVAILAYATNLTTSLGAHPWWAGKVIWIGLPIGLVLGATVWAIGLPQWLRLAGSAILVLAGVASAYFGKKWFAASFAENALAGQMWYFGWIATCAFTAAMLASVVLRHRQID